MVDNSLELNPHPDQEIPANWQIPVEEKGLVKGEGTEDYKMKVYEIKNPKILQLEKDQGFLAFSYASKIDCGQFRRNPEKAYECFFNQDGSIKSIRHDSVHEARDGGGSPRLGFFDEMFVNYEFIYGDLTPGSTWFSMYINFGDIRRGDPNVFLSRESFDSKWNEDLVTVYYDCSDYSRRNLRNLKYIRFTGNFVTQRNIPRRNPTLQYPDQKNQPKGPKALIWGDVGEDTSTAEQLADGGWVQGKNKDEFLYLHDEQKFKLSWKIEAGRIIADYVDLNSRRKNSVTAPLAIYAKNVVELVSNRAPHPITKRFKIETLDVPWTRIPDFVGASLSPSSLPKTQEEE